jgi:hypothetical protein
VGAVNPLWVWAITCTNTCGCRSSHEAPLRQGPGCHALFCRRHEACRPTLLFFFICPFVHFYICHGCFCALRAGVRDILCQSSVPARRRLALGGQLCVVRANRALSSGRRRQRGSECSQGFLAAGFESSRRPRPCDPGRSPIAIARQAPARLRVSIVTRQGPNIADALHAAGMHEAGGSRGRSRWGSGALEEARADGR